MARSRCRIGRPRPGRGHVIGTQYDPDNLNKRLSALTRSAGLGHWSSHELRHSAASLLLALGLGLKVVSETLGHSSIVVTADVYSYLLADQRDAPVQALFPTANSGARSARS